MEIKNPKPEDYEKILRFLENVYGHSYKFFPLGYPHVWKKDNFNFEETFIIEKDGKICSLVRNFPIITIQNGIKIKFGGIGSVSTDYEERNQGYMTALLNHAIKRMEENGYHLSILWGDRHRYMNFGYENSGKVITLTITNRGMQKANVSPIKTERYLGQKNILEKIIETYNKNKYRVERNYEYFYEIYKKVGTATYYAEENNQFAYVVIGTGPDSKVFEYGGPADLIVRILKYLIERFGKKFSIDFPDFSEIPEIMWAVSTWWNITPAGMIKIISLKRTIEAFLPLIEKNIDESDEIVFEILNKEKVGIKKEGGKVKFINESENYIKLSEIEMVRLFFNPCISEVGNKKTNEILKKFLPINIFFPLLDHI